MCIVVCFTLDFYFYFCFFFCKQKTAYEMRISDWSSDVCSSDLFFQDFIGFMAENRQLAETLVFEFDQASIAAEDYMTRMNLQRLRGFGYRFSMDQVTDMDLDLQELAAQGFRSEARRVGKECVSTCRSGWSPYH